MHLVPGIVGTSQRGVVQATRSSCGPLLNIAYLNIAKNYNRQRAEQCIEFNQSVIDYLATTPSLEVVVLSSPFREYLTGNQQLIYKKGAFSEIAANTDSTIIAMRNTVHAVRAIGKRVVIVAPPPSSDFDMSLCLERKISKKLRIGPYAECEIPIPTYYTDRAEVLEFLERLPKEAEVEVVSFDSFLCGDKSCKTFIDGIFVYRDFQHLSYDGSVLLAQRTSLAKALFSLAK